MALALKITMDKEKIIFLTNHLYKLTLLFPKKEPLRYKMRELADEILIGVIKMNSLSVSNSSNSSFSSAAPLKKTEICEEEIIDNLDILDSFFNVAKEQNWVSLSDLEIIQSNYNELKKEVENQRIKKTNSQPSLVLGKIQKENETREGAPVFSAFPEEGGNSLEQSQREEEQRKEREKKKEEAILSERQEKILVFLKEQGRAQVWQVKQILPEVTKRTLRRDFENLLKKGIIERIGEKNNTFYQIKKS